MDPARRSFFGARRAGDAPLRPPWSLDERAFVERCTRCDDCLRACPTGVLRVGEGGYPVVDFSRAACTLCGDCVTACRDGALLRNDGQPTWRHTLTIVASCLPKYAGDTSFASKFTDEDMQALFGGIVFAQTMPLATGETPADSLMIVPVDERWMCGGRVSDGLDSLFPADGGYGTPQEMTAAQYEPFKCENPNERNEAE